MESDPKAEEIIAEIYRQVLVCRSRAVEPKQVLLPYRYVRRLRVYRFFLGDLGPGGIEYLDRYSIFGLEFFVHQEDKILVH